MFDHETVESFLRRLFHGGPIRRMPRKKEDADVLMALALVALDSERSYDESDINAHLSAWLEDIASEVDLDHVTLRRFLVDAGFLRRASDGVIYRVEAERIDRVLSPEAKAVDPKAIHAEILFAREERARSFRR